MTKNQAEPEAVALDVSDVDHRVGGLVGGGQLWDPCSTSDIRHWVMAMAMDNPNPLHSYFDAEVIDKEAESTWGVPLVQIKLKLTNQDGNVLVSSIAEVELPI